MSSVVQGGAFLFFGAPEGALGGRRGVHTPCAHTMYEIVFCTHMPDFCECEHAASLHFIFGLVPDVQPRVE